MTLHKLFAQKYGKEYVTEASSDVTYHRCENLASPKNMALKMALVLKCLFRVLQLFAPVC